MGHLSDIARSIEVKFGLTLEFVSGGNSANYSWFMDTKEVGEINNLRLGESIYLGCETLDRKNISKLFYDAFTLFSLPFIWFYSSSSSLTLSTISILEKGFVI